jgi:hypothetical protein
MRSFLSRMGTFVAQVGAILGVCVGCVPDDKSAPAKPPETHWQGHETGYSAPSQPKEHTKSPEP